MLVREIMTSPAVSVHEEDWAAHAVSLLDRMNVTCLPVLDAAGRLVGLVGEADLARRLADASSTNGHHRRHVATRVQDLMTHDVRTIRADDDVNVALALMNGTGLKTLPVILHERVVGMLSRRDIVRALALDDLEADGVLTGT